MRQQAPSFLSQASNSYNEFALRCSSTDMTLNTVFAQPKEQEKKSSQVMQSSCQLNEAKTILSTNHVNKFFLFRQALFFYILVQQIFF